MGRNIDIPGMMFAFVATSVFLLGTWGWIWNIIKIIQFDDSTGMFVARVLGAFLAPLGMVLGYF